MQVNLIYANPAAYKLFGCDPEKEDLIGTSGARFWLEKDIPFLQQTVLPQAMAGGWMGEVKNRRADGTIIDVHASTFVILDAQNQPVSLVASIRDITDRKQIETVARETVERLNVVLNSMPIVLYTLDREGTFTLSEGKGLATLGLKPGQVVGVSAFDVYKDFPIIVESIKRVLTGETFTVEFSVGPIVFENMFAPLYNATGELTGAIGISTDITARKQAEAEARRMQEQIIEAQRHALQELSTPIIPVLDRIIVMPLIGSIDSMRAKDITRSLLAGISQYRAKIVIVDITGVPLVDSGVADHLNKTIQAARLKGAQTIVTGMSDAVAEAIIDLGIDWSEIQTLSDLQTGLMVAISTLGLKLGR
jgi:rsbT co-antagonist protein RsbR